MKIINIIAGSGGTFYCQNCMRDAALVKALRDKGHDVIMVPMYLPLYTDDPNITRGVPVFFGGLNVYFQHKLKFFRKTPRWVDRLFDAPWLLKILARFSGSTKPSELGSLTLSMLKGEDGNQVKEIERLITWLKEKEKPDVIHISSILLVGLVRRLKAELGVPVLCTLQDEETWLDAIRPPYDSLCWETMVQRAAEVDLFVAVSRYYGDVMRYRLHLRPERVQVVHVGIDLEGYVPSPMSFDPPTIGYLSKMTPSLGLEILVDAFIELKKDERLRSVKLRATGGQVGPDRAFVRGLQRKLAKAGCAGDVEFSPEFDRPQRLEFLSKLSVMCVPVPAGEAFGAYIIEAAACGVPSVQPKAGAYPEILGITGSGIIYEPNKAANLAAVLRSLLLDPARARQLGEQGRTVVRERFSIQTMAENMTRVYQGVIH